MHIPNVITRNVGRQILNLRSASPTLMFGAGVVGVVGTVVLASRATLRLEETLESIEGKQEKALKHFQQFPSKYTEDDLKHDQRLLKIQAARKVTRLYAPAFILGAVSIGCLTGAHVTLSRRNAGLTAAYAALDKGFREYRSRVIKELGEDKDREFRYGFEDREIVEEGEHGPEVKRVREVGPDGRSIYAKFFDQFNPEWSPSAENNMHFIRCQQNYMNNKLQADGYLLLNDVYEALRMEKTKAGCVVGWVLGKDRDNYVDFGVFDGNNEMARHFVNGREHSILLDFNVDGIVYDKLKD